MNPARANEIVNAARAKVSREKLTKDHQLELARKHAYEHEMRRRAFVAEHGALLWRAMAYYGSHRFVTSVLDCFQGWGDLRPLQIEGLRKAVAYREHQEKPQ